MNAEIKTKWLAALRSGEFKQGQSRLKTGDGAYCCLGVLCHITGKLNEEDCTYSEDDEGRYIQSETDLVPELAAEFSLTDYQGFLVAMNDGTGIYNTDPKSFAQIADWIEANL